MDKEGKHAWRRNKSGGAFHALSDSEIYTTEYFAGRPGIGKCVLFGMKYERTDASGVWIRVCIR